MTHATGEASSCSRRPRATHIARRLILSLLGIMTVVVAVAARPVNAQAGADLFQQGLRKERVEGDIRAAIAIYERVAGEHASNRALAARALVQLGGAYEALGKAEARMAYQRVVRDYSDQADQATIARSRLAALTPGGGVANAGQPVVRRVWAGEGVDGLGAPTRDGRLITFTDWETGDLAVRDLTSGQNRRLTNKGPWNKSVEFSLNSRPSPDGRHVAYTWFGESSFPELRIVSMEGGEPRVLKGIRDVDYVQPYDWSPDGKHIAAAVLPRSPKTAQLALVTAADGSVRVLKTLDWRGPERLSFSPDGRYIAYDAPSGATGTSRDIFVIAIDGSSETTLVKHSALDIVLGWAPDGRHVLFGSDRTGNMSVWRVPIANGKATGEPVLVRRDSEFSVTPMGFARDATFYYSTQPAPIDIYVATLDPRTGRATGAATRFADGFVGANRSPAWSKDGRQIAYLSQRRPGVPGRSGRQLVVRSLETGAERVVPVQLQRLWPPYWSPDDRSFIMSGTNPAGEEGIFRVDASSAEATLLVPGTNRRMKGWMSDGESFVYLHQDFPARSLALIRHNPRTGESKDIVRVARHNLWDASVSPDGKQIAFAIIEGDSIGIRVVGENGGEVRRLYTVPPGEYLNCCGPITWSADGLNLFVAQTRKEAAAPTRLLRLPVAGGPPEETGVVMDHEIQALRSHPDGRRIAFTAGSQEVEVWAMENFLPDSRSTSSRK